MSDFDELVQAGAHEAAELMDDHITVLGQTVPSVFDEDSMSVDQMRFGTSEAITAQCVVSLADLDELPKERDRVTRVKTGRTYFIASVSTDAGHCEMQLTREGRPHGAR
jgi:hypothetical protein